MGPLYPLPLPEEIPPREERIRAHDAEMRRLRLRRRRVWTGAAVVAYLTFLVGLAAATDNLDMLHRPAGLLGIFAVGWMLGRFVGRKRQGVV